MRQAFSGWSILSEYMQQSRAAVMRAVNHWQQSTIFSAFSAWHSRSLMVRHQLHLLKGVCLSNLHPLNLHFSLCGNKMEAVGIIWVEVCLLKIKMRARFQIRTKQGTCSFQTTLAFCGGGVCLSVLDGSLPDTSWKSLFSSNRLQVNSLWLYVMNCAHIWVQYRAPC